MGQSRGGSMNNKINKIILCANDVTQIGGVSRVIHTLAREFKNQGFEVELLGMNTVSQEISFELPEDIKNLPVTVAYSAQPPAKSSNLERWSKLRGEAVGYLRRYFEEQDPESTLVIVLQVYVMEHLLETGIDFSATTGFKVIGAYHSSYIGCKASNDLNRVKRAYSDITRFICLTEKDRDLFALEGMTNGSYLYNPIELMSSIEIPAWTDRDKKLVFVGRLSREKNIPAIIDAWSKVAPDFPEWSFEIYGTGPEESKVSEAILKSGQVKRTHLMGSTQNPEQVFATARLNVMNSNFEGLPVSIVEAGLVGTPTLVTNTFPGAEVLVEDNVTGFTPPPNDTEAYVAALRGALSDQDKLANMGEASRKKMTRFSPTQIMEDWDFLLKSLSLI